MEMSTTVYVKFKDSLHFTSIKEFNLVSISLEYNAKSFLTVK